MSNTICSYTCIGEVSMAQRIRVQPDELHLVMLYCSYIQSVYTHEQFTLYSGSPHNAVSICLVLCVMLQVDDERIRLEAEADELVKAGDSDSERLMDIYERLDDLDATMASTRAGRILHGLGFTKGSVK